MTEKSPKYVLGIDFSASQNVFFLAERETGKVLYSKKIDRGAFYCYGEGAQAEIDRRKHAGKLPEDWKPPEDVPLNDLRRIELDERYVHMPRDQRAAHFLYDEAAGFLWEAKEKGGAQDPFTNIGALGLSVAGKVFRNGELDGVVMFLGGNTPTRFAVDLSDGQKAINATSTLFTRVIEITKQGPIEVGGVFPALRIRGGNDCNTIGMAIARVYQTKGIDPNQSYYITISTGIGGGGPLDMVDEVGHHSAKMPLMAQLKCGCGRMDCIEAYASGTGLPKFAKRIVELANDKPKFQEFTIAEGAHGFKINAQTVKDSELAKRIKTGDTINSKDVFDAWKKDDKLAAYLVDRSADMVADLIVNLSMDYSLRVVSIGGGVGQNQPEFVNLIEKKANQKRENCGLITPITVEQNPLGKVANAYGALAPVIPGEYGAAWTHTMLEEARRVKEGDKETLARLQLESPAAQGPKAGNKPTVRRQ